MKQSDLPQKYPPDSAPNPLNRGDGELSWRDRANQLSPGERYLYQLFSLIEIGDLTVTNSDHRVFHFGNVGSEPPIHLIIHNANTYDRILTFGTLGFCEAYMEGWWDEENNRLFELLGLLYRNRVVDKAREYVTIALILKVIKQRLQTLPVLIQNSRKNVQYHYDLGNDFYQNFLDPTMTYSCGYRLQETDSLEQMQLQKYDLICRKLELKPGESLIDIGCGWGGMLIYAAEHYGISGTGITLSEEQAKLAQERIEQRGLSDRIQIILKDYREVQGQYDKLVSIGMFEHVGKGNFTTFMQKSAELLTPQGVGLLHTITTENNQRNGAWVDKYIFPGGYAPQFHELTQALWTTKLVIAHCENLKPHYAETLKHWAHNFMDNRTQIAALAPAYDERFLRMWHLYLQSFEASFRYGDLQVYQLLFYKDKPWRLNMPLTFTPNLESASVAHPTPPIA